MMVSRRKIENFNLRRKVPLINENRASEGKPKNFIVFLLKMDHRALLYCSQKNSGPHYHHPGIE